MENIDTETGEVIEDGARTSFETKIPNSVNDLMSQDFATWFLEIKPSLDAIYKARSDYSGDGSSVPDLGTIRQAMRAFAGYLVFMAKPLAMITTFSSLKEAEFLASVAAKDLSPTVAKKRAEAHAHKEIMVKNWITELNKSLSKILDSARSEVSFEKEQLREHGGY